MQEQRQRRAEVRVFLLSPASLAGVRGRRVLTGATTTPALAPLMEGRSVPLAEVYTSISSLYFRGKITYARRFARAPAAVGPPVRTITPDRGLLAVDEPVDLATLRAMAEQDIDAAEPRYRRALLATAEALRDALPAAADVVLLGSIASSKYVEPLCEVFGSGLLVPASFVGRGDMSRGGLLLRAADEGIELEYEAALTVPRRGARPPRLAPRPRR